MDLARLRRLLDCDALEPHRWRWLRSGKRRGISLGSDHAGWRVRESPTEFLGRRAVRKTGGLN
jgi:hypothetical protein